MPPTFKENEVLFCHFFMQFFFLIFLDVAYVLLQILTPVFL